MGCTVRLHKGRGVGRFACKATVKKEIDQIAAAHQVDDIDEARQVDPVDQIDDNDAHTRQANKATNETTCHKCG